MSRENFSIWFWQEMVTPHMVALAAALAERGFKVNYVANEELSKERKKQGWELPELGKVKLLLASDKDTVITYALEAPEDTIHLCQGLRGNGLVGVAQNIIRKRGLEHWVMMETVSDKGWFGFIKRLIYNALFIYWRNSLSGVLAIGNNASKWFVNRGMNKERVYSFAYFLKKPKFDYFSKIPSDENKNRPFRFIYVGQLIKRKRVKNLIQELANLNEEKIELWIVGDGPQKNYLKSLANKFLQKKVVWLGVLSMKDIPNIIYKADCLVLPSIFDGWGVTVSEALMVGTPVICSDMCGSSILVKASKAGTVFSVNNKNDLKNSLKIQFEKGLVDFDERQKLINWAKCLDPICGAEYLEKVINLKNNQINYTKLPWKQNN